MRVRDGSKIRFWNDLWPDHLLKVTFPELFSITRCKEAIVANLCNFLKAIFTEYFFY